MNLTYQLLKSSWGIVIYLNIEEILNPDILDTDTVITESIYLRIANGINFERSTLLKYMIPAVSEFSDEIGARIGNQNVCYYLKVFDFSICDFQEEGIFCATQEWLSKYYQFDYKEQEVIFDRIRNRYDFRFLIKQG
ncbi:hypothetical protein [Flavihumibacter petaseus]|uniref:Uncharacterized protein n=1 Tax=Flavihumibacter petaseus NBRC 106054 TaxID=1220578 RepID=A0A0E9N653_9BACT|nr:hypothetical protein [Flavihumibacter petaseus]GAO45402.1 hypothetical protein FPE01S_05_00970 [Flavihumibacter petaseus NBRC 106054]